MKKKLIKALSSFLAVSVTASSVLIAPALNNRVYADSKTDNKVYMIVTGFTHIWGYANNPATDGTMSDMEFSSANYNIVSPMEIYDFDKKKVKVGFGSSFKDGANISLKELDNALGVKDAKVYPYDPSFAGIEEDKWSSSGIDIINGKTVAFNETARAADKPDYEYQYYNRKTSVSNVSATFDQNTKTLKYTYTNTVPSFSYSSLDDMESRLIRLDKLARRSFSEVDLAMSEYSGNDWKNNYPEVVTRLKEANKNTSDAKRLRGYMFFTPMIIEVTLDKKAELAMADVLFQADKTSFTDGTGTLRDRLEIYDMKNNLVIGDSLSTGEKYKMCSYVLNMGSVDTTRPVNADFYMVTEDIRNMSLPNHLKTALGSSSPNQPDVKAFLPVNRMATYCKEFETPSVGREIRLESQIPDSYIPDDDTKATNNIAIRIMQLAPQDLAYSDIASVGDLKPNTSNTFKVVMCKVEGTEKVEAMYTRIWAKDKNGNIIRDSVSKGSNSLNKPGDCTEYNVPINIPGNEVTVCARVDERHAANGENYDLSNDEGCRTFAAERDFFVSNFEISPSSIILDPIKVDKDGKAGPAKSYSGNFTFSYDVNLEEGKDNTSYTVDAVLRDYNGSELNRQSVTLKQGESKKVTFSRNYTFAPGKYGFEARVNLDPKKVQEYSKVLADPYQNNKQAREISIRNDLQPNKTTTCNTQLTDLQEDYPDVNGIATHKGWTTTYHIVEKYGHEEERERCETTCTGEGEDRECDRDCWTYTVCVTDNIVEWDESIGHSQEFKIDKVEFRSKMTKDEYIKKNNIKSNTVKENEGWVDITNATGEIRAGYGYELRVTVKYEDNLADTCSCGPVYCSWSTECESGGASPGIPGRGPKPKGSLYITFPGEDQIEVREFKETTSCSVNPNKEFTRVYTFDGSNINGTGVNKKRFVDENTKTGTVLGIKITTSSTPGAQPGPDEIPRTVLCDEGTFNFEVKGNFAQDFITQIVQ